MSSVALYFSFKTPYKKMIEQVSVGTTAKHRHVVYRADDGCLLDTGYTTASSDEISQDQSLKRKLISLTDLSNKRHRNETMSTPPRDLTRNEEEPVQEDESILDAPRPPDQVPLKLYESESPESEPETFGKRVVTEKKREQGKRLADYMKRLRATGNVKKPVRKEKLAGLIFPVSKVISKMKETLPHQRILTTGGVFLAGVIEYLVAELLEISGEIAIEQNRKRINPRHIFLAIKHDLAFDTVLKDVDIYRGGVLPSSEPSVSKQVDGTKVTKEPVTSEVTSEAETAKKRGRKSKPAGYDRLEQTREHSQDVEKHLDTTQDRLLFNTTEDTVGTLETSVKEKKKARYPKKRVSKAKQEQGKRLAEYMRKKRLAAKQSSFEADETSDKENAGLSQSSSDKTYIVPMNSEFTKNFAEKSSTKDISTSRISSEDLENSFKSRPIAASSPRRTSLRHVPSRKPLGSVENESDFYSH